jgi:mono/diheme cytochrome c family protein
MNPDTPAPAPGEAPRPQPQRRQGMDYSETSDVHQVHAAIQREKTEPRAGLEPLSIWLVVIYGLAIFLGGAYLGRYSGSFAADGLDWSTEAKGRSTNGGPDNGATPPPAGPVERGQKVYAANCATCHQPNGAGVPGQYPPLAGSPWVLSSPRRLAMIVLKGFEGPHEVLGVQYGSAVMQPWEKTLNDQRIADVLTYIRQAWGNNAPAVAPEGIAALRKELAGRTALYREDELKAVPDDADLPGAPAAAPEGGGAP